MEKIIKKAATIETIIVAARTLTNCQYQVMSHKIMRKKISHAKVNHHIKEANEKLKVAIRNSDLEEKNKILLLSDEQLGILASKITVNVLAKNIKAPG